MSPRPSVRRTVLAAALGLTLATAGCAGGTGNPDRAGTGAPFGMAHVHGLGVDPGSGELLAGTHYGTFVVGEDGQVEQIGPTQDYMGFTVVGPDHYLASGHPGADSDAPSDLGLIESTDGGRTWSTLSLAGEADFHTLEARHGRVYGHSGGQLMVSDDTRTWQERGTIPLVGLAISPRDRETLVATTEQGLVLSSDGGRSFSRLPGSPAVLLVSWTEDGSLLGATPTGDIHVSDDDGATWEQRGAAGGQPAALTAVGDEVFVATHDGRIVESSDGGRTFTTRYREA